MTLSDDEYWGVNMLGRVENNTSVTQSDITVVAFLFDASGNILDIRILLSSDLVQVTKWGLRCIPIVIPPTTQSTT